jgi:hypothetical protein
MSDEELQATRWLNESPSAPDIPFEEANVPSNAWWLTTALPPPFMWVSYPQSENTIGIISVPGDNPEYPALITRLREWAAENDLVVHPERELQAFVGGNPHREPVLVRRPASILIGRENPDSPFNFGTYPEWQEEFTCPHCGELHLAYTDSCNGLAFACANCGATDTQLVDTGHNTVCTACGRPCDIDGCGVYVVGENRLYCEDHRIEAYCAGCDTYMERNTEDEPFVEAVGGGIYCDECTLLVCQNCHRYYRRGLTWNSDLELNVCRRCLFVGADGTSGESFDEDADMTNKAMQIPTIPGRENVRQCGIEIEGANGDGNGNDLALALYDAGLSTIDGMAGYHHGDGSGFAHVERDSSVDWEVVIGPLNPAHQGQVRELNRVVRIIREHIKDGRLGLDLRAGCHIHVEAARTSLTGAFNLNTLFAYLEDVIFRLAAARWPVHRAIMDTHYTAPIPKDLRKLQFARTHNNDEDARYYALSFQNYFNRVLSNCHCGAVRYDSWEECECDLGKCTFEFRVFNTTANPRKLHAYMALAQALVAKAMSLGDLDNASDAFPALEFRTRRFKDMPETEQEEIVGLWRDRLAWMFNELPLTDAEKESIAYCIRHSELEQVGAEFIKSLLPEQQLEEAIA